MIINIGNHEFTELWDGVLYKALSNYPTVSDNEMKDIIDFVDYEKANGRNCEITADRQDILDYVRKEMRNPDKYKNVRRPEIIKECIACTARGGCMTDLVCHTAPLENAISILKCGSLLSAVNARKLPDTELKKEERNAANDPVDFFHYVMFSWGNCQAGDRLVMERKLGRSPNVEDMGVGFTPGVRFYFRYDELEKHPQAVHDGFLPIKVKDEVNLADYVYMIIIPIEYKNQIMEVLPEELKNRTFYFDHYKLDVWQWSEKVYSFVHEMK
jgi:hypothetical protein